MSQIKYSCCSRCNCSKATTTKPICKACFFDIPINLIPLCDTKEPFKALSEICKINARDNSHLGVIQEDIKKWRNLTR